MSDRKEFICETWKQKFNILKSFHFLSPETNKQTNAQAIGYVSAGSFTHRKLHYSPTETPFFIQFGG